MYLFTFQSVETIIFKSRRIDFLFHINTIQTEEHFYGILRLVVNHFSCQLAYPFPYTSELNGTKSIQKIVRHIIECFYIIQNHILIYLPVLNIVRICSIIHHIVANAIKCLFLE